MISIEEGFPSQTLVRMPVDSIARMRQLPLCRSLYITDIGHYPEATSHLVKRSHGYSSHILIYCVGGRGFCAFGENSLTIEAGQALLIPAGQPHEYGTAPDESWRIYWAHFSGSESNGLFDLLSEDRQSTSIYLPFADPIIAAFHDTIRWTRHGHTTNNLVALSAAFARLLGILIEGKRPSASRARQVEERVRCTLTRMRESIRSPLTLKQLADEAALSVPHFCSVFKKQTGTSPIQLYTQLRIQLACELLHNTQLEIWAIAEETGYTDAYYFSRTFKRVMGVSPSSFRNGLGR